MSTVFTFSDIFNAKDDVIAKIIGAISQEELAVALKRESTEIRRRFYKNLTGADDPHNLREDIKHSDADLQQRIKAQEKVLAIIAAQPEYRKLRFLSRFYTFDDFLKAILNRGAGEKPYGFMAEVTPSSSFFKSANGQKALDEIIKKNKTDNHNSFIIPHAKLQLVNYSECPKCGKVYSYKDLLKNYQNPRPDAGFKKGREAQLREDSRMYCIGCKTYFLPALLLMDETAVKCEYQFLSIMNTLNAIEDHYAEKGFAALSRDWSNLLKSDGVSVRVYKDLDDEARSTFATEVFSPKGMSPPSKILRGIRSDIFLKELELRPTLMSNLLQYSSKNEIALNLIQGNNVDNKDTLFGIWR
ncbi:MAG: hypothetical protein FWG77_09695 [Treponema sp.]|nr:hypothetical protein [Treponema sp.]